MATVSVAAQPLGSFLLEFCPKEQKEKGVRTLARDPETEQ